MDWVRTSYKDKISYFDFRKTKTHSLDAFDAAIQTVLYITKKYPPPYTLLLSGGVDSQAMLWSWHKSNVPYTTLSAVYNYNLNDHDLDTIREFAKKHNISINFSNFDLIEFLENEYETYAYKYLCGSPQICTFMKIADTVENGTVIMSGNFIYHNSVNIPKNVTGLLNYKNNSNKQVIPFFFLETEELAWAFNDYLLPRCPAYEEKVQLYHHFGFPVIAQPKKYNGFEKVKDWYDEHYKKQILLENKLSRVPGQGSNRTFDLLYRNKYEAKFAEYKYTYLC